VNWTNWQKDVWGAARRLWIKAVAMMTLLLMLCVTGAARDADNFYPTTRSTKHYSYFNNLPTFKPGTPLESGEMRIVFLGSMIPPVRRAQQMMSVYVEVGNAAGEPDHFVFDCGSGVCANYGAMGIGFDKMDKVFIAHLHGDHMSDLTHIYCFGPPARQSPLFVFGPSASNKVWTEPYDAVYNPNPKTFGPFDDGTASYCTMLRAALRWHSEAFSFQNTSYAGYDPNTIKDDWGLPCDPVPVRDPRAAYSGGERYNQDDYVDASNDAYAIIPVELDWTKRGDGFRAGSATIRDNVAYANKKSGVTITHFPVIHTRQGSIGYKLEWNGMTMIYTSDTKPESNCLVQANNNGGRPVDVFIHEMIVPPQIWAMKDGGLKTPPPFDAPGVQQLKTVQDSSHSPQGAYGYLLSQILPRPRLAVACHFPVADDTVYCALKSVQEHCPDIKRIGKGLVWAFDLMVLRVTKEEIKMYRAKVSDFGFAAPTPTYNDEIPPRYWTWELDANGNRVYDDAGNPVRTSDPFAQIDQSTVIPATNQNGSVNYREDGY